MPVESDLASVTVVLMSHTALYWSGRAASPEPLLDAPPVMPPGPVLPPPPVSTALVARTHTGGATVTV
ncbi:hypothetical protein D9M69_552800 [compost metagenome]